MRLANSVKTMQSDKSNATEFSCFRKLIVNVCGRRAWYGLDVNGGHAMVGKPNQCSVPFPHGNRWVVHSDSHSFFPRFAFSFRDKEAQE